jgi:taurine dioxygenase
MSLCRDKPDKLLWSIVRVGDIREAQAVILGSDLARTTSGSLIEVTPTRQPLGAEVRNVDVSMFDDWAFAAFMRALLKHQTLLVRGQRLSDRELAAFSHRFGHAGLLYTPYGTMLGGNASFSSLFAVYDGLPPALRRRIANLKIRHLASKIDYSGRDHLQSDRSAISGTVQPLVSMHPDTGRSLLALGLRHQAYLVGLDLAESDALLDELWEFAARPEFAWSHECRGGDLLVWDRRCTIHQRATANATHPRLLHRAEIWNSMSMT